MRPKNKTEDALLSALVLHYIMGEFPKMPPARGSDFALGQESRLDFSPSKNKHLFPAIFGLPPNGEILHRDFWLIRSSRFIEGQTNWSKAVALQKHIAEFRANDLKAWEKILKSANGRLPISGMLPPDARSRWIESILYEHFADDPTHPTSIRSEKRTEADRVKVCLYFAFANSRKMPSTRQALSSIIDRDFGGLAGELAIFLYRAITSLVLIRLEKP